MASQSEKEALLGLEAARPSPPSRTKASRRRSILVLWTTVAVLFWSYLFISSYLSTDDNDESGLLPENGHKKTGDFCLTPACVHASSELLYNLSPDYENLDACTDFEELVCGGWRDRHDLRADQGDAFTGTIMAENSQMLLRHILAAPYPKDSAHSSFSPMQLAAVAKKPDEANFDKMKAAYDACMDEEAIKKEGLKPMLKIINEVKELFPLSLSDITINDERLQTAILYLYRLQITAIIAPYTSADDKDPDRVVVSITPPQRFGLPATELYKDDTVVTKYKNVISDVFNALFPALQAASIGDAIVAFEKKLAAAAPREEDRNDVTVSHGRRVR